MTSNYVALTHHSDPPLCAHCPGTSPHTLRFVLEWRQRRGDSDSLRALQIVCERRLLDALDGPVP